MLALIAPHEQARGMILVPDSIKSNIGVLSILFSGPSMIQPLIMAADPWERSTIWSVGGGVDLRLGQHFLLSIDSLLNERSIEAGIHLGYGWNL